MLPSVYLKSEGGFIHRHSGWRLVQEGPRVEGEAVLDFFSFSREGETSVTGHTVLARANGMDGSESGQHHLERFLALEDIPVELRAFKLVATATFWADEKGNLFLPAVVWAFGSWVLDFTWVGEDTRGYWDVKRNRVARVRK